MTPPISIELERELSEKLTIHKNLGQEIVVTTVDKAKLCIIHHQQCLTAKREWLTPLGLLIAFVTTLIAADFKDFGLKAAVWTAIYILASVLSFAWLLVCLARIYQNRDAGSVDHLLNELKASTDTLASRVEVS